MLRTPDLAQALPWTVARCGLGHPSGLAYVRAQSVASRKSALRTGVAPIRLRDQRYRAARRRVQEWKQAGQWTTRAYQHVSVQRAACSVQRAALGAGANGMPHWEART